MKIVYIPPALYPALKKAELRAQDLRDVEKLLSTLSADDVAFYFAANDARRCPIPKPLADTLPNLIFGGDAVMPFTDSDQSKAVLGKFNSINANGSMADMYEEGSLLTSDCSEEDLLIITHVAADASVGENAAKNDKVFYDRIIQQLLAFQPLEAVMGSPLLLGWMKSVQALAETPRK
ncbi:hypothetical protein [Xanthomonas phage RTH11]|nr:hypothetical protein [Xanthomonas phage RTH11]